jgi:hypothetical protein
MTSKKSVLLHIRSLDETLKLRATQSVCDDEDKKVRSRWLRNSILKCSATQSFNAKIKYSQSTIVVFLALLQ